MMGFGITKRFLYVQLAAIFLAVLLSVARLLTPQLGLIPLGLVLLAAIVDFLRTPGKKRFGVTRQLPANFEQFQDAQIALEIVCPPGKAWHLRVADSPPPTFRWERKATAYPRQTGSFVHRYTVVPTQRGLADFGRCYLEVVGSWGLSTKRLTISCPDTPGIYPNLEPMRHYRLLAQRNQLAREDAALHKIRGVGTDFAGIKEYTPDDDRRKVNWKASARSGKLMTNVFDVEKNREVIIAVDTGRWMQAPMEEGTRLDKALELAAAIMQVATASGDRVGLVLFGTQVTHYLAPGKGTAHIQTFLQGLYSAQPSPGQSSLAALSGMLRRKLTRRAFVCLLTYLDNPAEAAQAAVDLIPLHRRHSLYIALLADVGLDALLQTQAATPETVYLKTAAAYRKQAELGAADLLLRHGINAHAAEPSDLLVRSVRQYLSVKRLPQ